MMSQTSSRVASVTRQANKHLHIKNKTTNIVDLQDSWQCIQLYRAERHAPCHEIWLLTKTNLQRLQRNDRAMIRHICSIKPEDVATGRSSELLAPVELEDYDLI